MGLALIGKFEFFSLRDGDPRDVTPFQYITGAAACDEGCLSQTTADTASFYFREV